MRTVLHVLPAPIGSTSTNHDGLQEMMRRLGCSRSGLGQPVKACPYISLTDRMPLQGRLALDLPKMFIRTTTWR